MAWPSSSDAHGDGPFGQAGAGDAVMTLGCLEQRAGLRARRHSPARPSAARRASSVSSMRLPLVDLGPVEDEHAAREIEGADGEPDQLGDAQPVIHQQRHNEPIP